jgi:hypothetical protein
MKQYYPLPPSNRINFRITFATFFTPYRFYTMSKLLVALLLTLVLLSRCSNNNTPDVSNIKADITITRFDKDFFQVDTLQLMEGLNTVQKKYPYFFNDFIQHIVIAGPADSNLNLSLAVKSYIAHSRPLYDSVQIKFPRLQNLDQELRKGFQFVRYYYPDYPIPKVVTYVGLIGDPSVALTRDAMAIGLQMFLGKNFSAYNTPEAIDKFPQYISRRFEPQYITVNCLQNIAADIYPDNTKDRSLIEQMIEKGKQWYLTDKFLPAAPDSLKTGFTQRQLDWCKSNEGLVWNFIIQNNDVYTTDPNTIQNFIGEAPKTEGMPDASPGNLGQWIGWQIVKTFAEKNQALSPKQVVEINAKKIFDDAKYKPK